MRARWVALALDLLFIGRDGERRGGVFLYFERGTGNKAESGGIRGEGKGKGGERNSKREGEEGGVSSERGGA